jgi:hypothetical protein
MSKKLTIYSLVLKVKLVFGLVIKRKHLNGDFRVMSSL